MASPVLSEKSLFAKSGSSGSPMTFNEVWNKSILMFLISLGAIAVGWLFLPPVLLAPIAVASLGLGLWAGFSKTPKPGLYIAANTSYGLVVGGISGYLEGVFPGVVMQAVLATVAVLGVTLALYRSGKFRPTPKLTKIFVIAAASYLVFSVLNFVLMVTGVTEGMFGLHSDVVIFGIPLGIIVGVFAVILGTYSLILDFDFIEDGVARQIDESYAWTAAYGLVSTIVWIYFELLRLISIIRS